MCTSAFCDLSVYEKQVDVTLCTPRRPGICGAVLRLPHSDRQLLWRGHAACCSCRARSTGTHHPHTGASSACACPASCLNRCICRAVHDLPVSAHHTSDELFVSVPASPLHLSSACRSLLCMICRSAACLKGAPGVCVFALLLIWKGASDLQCVIHRCARDLGVHPVCVPALPHSWECMCISCRA